ncbi:hypothetical protein QAD02_012787 [Eretmocerus hayati]|uniref:Uncharacterized protein n=1 Tax=Eretmocerus hayati TaxID=131215 RepID=A0ACC2P0N7_9HYME|nr:hypothetical protein QAD02_012787 [Eretmocerus hayati]
MTDFLNVTENNAQQDPPTTEKETDGNRVNSEVIVEESKDRVEPIIDPNICGNRSSIVSPDEKQINHSGGKIDLIDNPAPSELNSSVVNTAIVSQDPSNSVLYGDISEWPASMSAMHTQVDYWVRVGNSHIPNDDVKILKSKSIVQDDHKKVRKCSPAIRILVPKRVDTTRWSSRTDSVLSVNQGYKGYQSALAELSSSNDEAIGLSESLNELETGVLLVFWNDILVQVNKTSMKLQSYNADLNSSIILLKSLGEFIESLRGKFEFYESRGKELTGSDEYHFVNKRRKEPNVRLGSLGQNQAPHVNLTSSDKFRVELYIPIIDSLETSLRQRIAAHEEVESIFGFLRKLLDLSSEEIETHAKNVLEEYGDDLEAGLINELIQFKPFIAAFLKEEEEAEQICFEAKAFKILIETDTQVVFPNVVILLRTYLVMMTTNCTSERSFSKLELLETRLRSMGQDRLNNLTRISAESNIMRELSLDDPINEFADRKARRLHI